MASETLLDLLESYVLAVNNAQFGIAYPGRSNGVGGYEIEVVNDPGRWWIRVWLNGQYSSIGKAIPLGVPRDPQQRCRTLVINGELCLMSPDPTALRLLYGNYANAAATGNTPTAVEGGDKNALGTVQPSPAGGMNVSISAYPAGGLYTFINAVDLTGDEPGSAGEFLWDVAYIDTDGTVKWAQSSPVTTTDPTALLPSQAKAVTIPAGAFRLYAVSLANGQTDIQKSRFINFQDDFAPEAVVAIDASAASIGDVATWNGTSWEADPPSGGGGTGDYILIREEQAQNNDGGTFTSGAWQPRVLNTIVSNVGGHASLSSNRITLAAGTYRANILCPALGVRQNQAQLQDITNAVTLLIGTNAYAAPNDPSFAAFSQSVIAGRFTLSGSTVLEVQHQCNSTVSTIGLGAACNFTTEIYTVVELIKE